MRNTLYWLAVVGIWAVVVALAVSRVKSTLHGPLAAFDLKQLYFAGRGVAAGQSIDPPTPFVYPPSMAVLWVPVVKVLTFHQAAQVDAALQVLAIFVTIAGSFYLAIKGPWAPVLAGVGCLVVLKGDVVVNSLYLENPSLLLAPFALAFVWLAAGNKWRTAAIVLAASILLKPLLLPFIVVLILRRRWADLGIFVGIVAVVTAVIIPWTGGLQALVHQVKYVLGGSSLVGRLSVYNTSLRGFGQYHHLNQPGIDALRIGIVAVLAWVLLKVKNRPITSLLDISAVATLAYLALILAGSLSEQHYPFIALPGLIIVGFQCRNLAARIPLASAAIVIAYTSHYFNLGGSVAAFQLRVVVIEVAIFIGLAASQLAWTQQPEGRISNVTAQ